MLGSRPQPLRRGARSRVERYSGWPARHPWHVALGAASAGLALPVVSPVLVVPAALLAAGTLALAGAGRLALLAAVALLAGAIAAEARLEAIDRPSRGLRPGTMLEARAELLGEPRPTRFGSHAELRLVSGPGRGARVDARADRRVRWPARAPPGLELRVTGYLSAPRSGAAGYAAHLRRRALAAVLVLQRVEATGRRRGGLAGALDSMRRRSERALSAGLPPAKAALARGMVLGQDERIDSLTRDDWRRSGLGHLLAVSGQNVMLLGALALPLLVACGLGTRARLAVLIALIALYVPLAGAGPSLQRAAVMGIAGTVALAAGRPASRAYALLLAAATTLVLNPRVSGEPGWQLSFAAVTGIAALGPSLRRPLSRLPAPLAEAGATTVAATVATAPLLAFHFGSVPLAALPANLLALAAVAPVMWIGMLQSGIGQLGAFGRPLEELALAAAAALSVPAGLLLGYLNAVALRFAEVPAGQLDPGRLPPLGLVAAYALIAAMAVAGRPAFAPLAAQAPGWGAAWRRIPRARRQALTIACAAVIALLVLRLIGPPRPPQRLTVSFLDVGQGDATLVQHPDGGSVLVDGGPPESRVVRLLRRAGVRRLSAVVATHASRDHHGGLREVLARIPVGVLIDGGDGSRDPEFRAMLAEAARRGVRRVEARAGLTVGAGALAVRVLSPPPRPPGPPPQDPNPRAVVAVVSSGDFDLFLSADAESSALARLPLPRVEAMKVPHHGSADPGLPGLLRRLRPRVAAIEVGAGNPYGHPDPRTLAALDRAVPRVLRTDRDGTIRLEVVGSTASISTHR